jgi:hypothetical protein
MPKSILMPMLLCLLFTACATITPPPLEYRPGAVVETLSSGVSFSVHTSDRSMGGHGYLVYHRPDQLRLVVLTPFGTTLFEAFVLDERITLVYASQMTAFTGRVEELPDKGGLQGWRMMRWMMDMDTPGESRMSGTVERMSRQGFMEKVTFENGLITAKTSPRGEQVFYSNYSVINGVPLPAEIEMRDDHEDRIRFTLDEPEINTQLDENAFLPRLEGMTILPLSAMQGL